MDEKGLGQRLQEARKTAGMTQQTLCHQANISYSTLAKIERGAIKSPSIFTIQNLTNALGISLDALLGTPPPQTSAAAQRQTSRSKNGIQFVYFDVNGCLVHFFQRAFTALARDTGASPDMIETAFWTYNSAACRGAMSMSDFNAELARSARVAKVDWQKYYLEAVEPVRGMEELVRWTAKHYRIGLLTNIMPGALAGLRSRGIVPDIAYDVIIDSSEVGETKPNNRMFDIAAERSGVLASEILLIDDDPPNVMAAGKLGWHVISCDDERPEDTVLRAKQTLELLT